MEPTSPLTEDELFELCDILLLYIEPGVFGELRLCPAMPPAPLHTGIFESATVILPSVKRNDDAENNEGKPLNLSLPQSSSASPSTPPNLCVTDNIPDAEMLTEDSALGYNQQMQNTSDNIHTVRMTPQFHFNTYAGARLSGTIERVINNKRLDELSSLISLPTSMNECTDTTQVETPVYSEPSLEPIQLSDNTVDEPVQSMKEFRALGFINFR